MHAKPLKRGLVYSGDRMGYVRRSTRELLMKTLKSYVYGQWHEASEGFRPLVDPTSGAQIAQASSAGVDFAKVAAYARETGGPALRALTFAQRAEALAAVSEALQEIRDELIEVSIENTGTTRKDAKFDVDGAIGTLGFYAYLGKELGDRTVLTDGEGMKLGRSAKFWGQHVLVPLEGVAVLINAFNFPAWGWAEKAACALLAGMPVVTKPATATALVAARSVEAVIGAGALPDGAFQSIVGSTGDLLSHLSTQDVLAFTGSADTALSLRRGENLLADNVRVNLEADSLNAAVLAPDVDGDSETFALLVKDVVREITQKTGQKCTAVRRVFVPSDRIDEVQAALAERLADVKTGNPRSESVTMGPLATEQQLADALAGIEKLCSVADIVVGTGKRADGIDADAGSGFFLEPTLLRAKDARHAEPVHTHEVFGPVCTLLPYDGTAQEAAELVALGRGSLVTSAYSNDLDWVGELVRRGGSYSGRIYLGSEKMAEQALGSGVALPQCQHGGPGRAGGGAELGGLAGLRLYMQRVALQGSRFMIDKLYG